MNVEKIKSVAEPVALLHVSNEENFNKIKNYRYWPMTFTPSGIGVGDVVWFVLRAHVKPECEYISATITNREDYTYPQRDKLYSPRLVPEANGKKAHKADGGYRIKFELGSLMIDDFTTEEIDWINSKGKVSRRVTYLSEDKRYWKSTLFRVKNKRFVV